VAYPLWFHVLYYRPYYVEVYITEQTNKTDNESIEFRKILRIINIASVPEVKSNKFRRIFVLSNIQIDRRLTELIQR
jgi:hypothetical protein